VDGDEAWTVIGDAFVCNNTILFGRETSKAEGWENIC